MLNLKVWLNGKYKHLLTTLIIPVVLLLGVCLFFSRHLWRGEVVFHTDVARDFLVLQEMVDTKKPTLLGPRSGGIPGVFHGPAWYYVSLPVFYLTNGNPVAMGWFWWALGTLGVLLFYSAVRQFTKSGFVAFVFSLLYAIRLLPGTTAAINTFVADMFGFLVFILWWQWWQKPTFGKALAAWFSLGVIFQFQMAFAAPLSVVLFALFVMRLAKSKETLKKKSIHALAALSATIPLSTFFLFEVRHSFLQTRSVLSYLQQEKVVDKTVLEFLTERLNQLFIGGLSGFGFNQYVSAAVVLVLLFIGLRSASQRVKSITRLFVGLYSFWWLITLAFKGTLWSYYYSPFLAIQLFVAAVIVSSFKKKTIVTSVLLVLSLIFSWNVITQPVDANSSSWKLLSTLAEQSLKNSERGYFVYSQDQFAYPLKYAFSYYLQSHPTNTSEAYTKKTETILVYSEDNPDNPYSTQKNWKENKVRITKEPEEVVEYPYGYHAELYVLSEDEIAVQPDENLILDLHFR